MNQIKEGDLVKVLDVYSMVNGKVGVVIGHKLKVRYWDGQPCEPLLAGYQILIDNRLVWCEKDRLLNLSDGQ